MTVDLTRPDLGHLTGEQLAAIDAWWRACNYLTIGQIYLKDNVLLSRPLRVDDIKPRLLGHWGTSPGLSFIYAHVSRLITLTGQEAIYLAGPGHGGPALVAASWLEGYYSEIYPDISRDGDGMHRLFRQFSSPGGIPSHVSVTTPGSIHEGGELGYVLVHAFGSVMDNPDLLSVAVVGDGEAETGPLEGSWKGISFLNPRRDGAVLPILHLNGAKIAGPTVLGRKPPAEVRSLFEGHGYEVIEVEGSDLPGMHHRFADRAGQGVRTDHRDPAVGPHRALGRPAAALADDHPAQPQGLDRAGRSRRDQGHRHLALASSAAVGRPGESRTPAAAGKLAALVPSRRALRSRRRPHRSGAGRQRGG